MNGSNVFVSRANVPTTSIDPSLSGASTWANTPSLPVNIVLIDFVNSPISDALAAVFAIIDVILFSFCSVLFFLVQPL
jgi:hypothetical protein